MKSDTCSTAGPWSSLTRRPSARKTTRPARAAATGSWVTMTTVLAELIDRLAQQIEHRPPGAPVQRPGWLVGEYHLRPGHQRPGDGHPLLLAAGQLGRPAPCPVGQPHPRQGLADRLGLGEAGPSRRSGSATFCSAVSDPIRLKDWNTNPTHRRRRRVSRRSDSRPRSAPPMRTWPEVGRWNRGRHLQQRRLPPIPTGPSLR